MSGRIDHLAAMAKINTTLDELVLALDTDPLNAREKPLDLFSKVCWRCGGRIKRRRAQPIHKLKGIARFAGQHGRQGHQDNIRGGSVCLNAGKAGDRPLKVVLSRLYADKQGRDLMSGIFHRLLSIRCNKREKAESGAGESPLSTSAEGEQ